MNISGLSGGINETPFHTASQEFGNTFSFDVFKKMFIIICFVDSHKRRGHDLMKLIQKRIDIAVIKAKFLYFAESKGLSANPCLV